MPLRISSIRALLRQLSSAITSLAFTGHPIDSSNLLLPANCSSASPRC